MNDGSTDDDVTFTAGTNISFGSTSETGVTINAVAGAGMDTDTTTADVLTITGAILSADDLGHNRIIYWDETNSKLTHLDIGIGVTIESSVLKATGAAGKTYTFESSDSSGNVNLTLSDDASPSVTDSVLLTAGTNVSFAGTSASGFTINVDSGAGLALGANLTEVFDLTTGTLSADDLGHNRLIYWDETNNKLTHLDVGIGITIVDSELRTTNSGSLTSVEVKQYSDNAATRTERTCTKPIGVVVESGTATIGIGTTSNAYGARYIQADDPTTSDGGSFTACDGDIWFDTSTISGDNSVSGSNRQVQFNDGGILAGAANLEFYKSATNPKLILKPSDTTDSDHGGYFRAQNADGLNYSDIHSDGGIELQRADETVTVGGPYIDFKYTSANDMDARIQMESAGGSTGDANFSSIKFLTGANNLGSGNVEERLRIGRKGQIGIAGANYGADGNVLMSTGGTTSVEWSHTPTVGEWWHSEKYSVAVIHIDGVMEIGKIIDFHSTAGTSDDYTARIDNTGSMALTVSNTISNSSDIRIKDNLVVIDTSLDKVGIITGYTFNYTNTGEESPPRAAGIIAQDIEKVLPEVITENTEGIKHVNYGGVTALLVEAIKELKAQNEDLKARIVKLESESK